MRRICLLCGMLVCLYGQADVVRVFFVAGQSNANGSGTDASLLVADPVDSDILLYYRTGAPPADGTDSNSGGAWTHLQAQTDNPGNGNFLNANGGFGPEIGIGRRLAQLVGDKVAIIKVAYNGTYLYSDWDADDPSGYALYPVFLSEANQALQLLEQAGDEVWISGFFWMQGESDAKSRTTSSPPPPQPETAEAYLDNLRALVHAVREDFSSPRMPVVVGRIAWIDTTTSPGNIFEYWDTIREAQVTNGETDPLGQWVDTDDLSKSDWLHYDTTGMLILGERMADAWLQAAHKAIYGGISNWIEVEMQSGSPYPVIALERPENVTGMSYQIEQSGDAIQWGPVSGTQSINSTSNGWEVVRERMNEPLSPGSVSLFRWRLTVTDQGF